MIEYNMENIIEYPWPQGRNDVQLEEEPMP